MSIELTKNQWAVYDHTKSNGFFGTSSPKNDRKDQDFEDCETLYGLGIFARRKAADWMGDEYIYHVSKDLDKKEDVD